LGWVLSAFFWYPEYLETGGKPWRKARKENNG
jgi:hypothetical protein